jgi:2-polyprenyl-6-methoxyphenol hydroxylase-like FAD-dependent oxidoreductase
MSAASNDARAASSRNTASAGPGEELVIVAGGGPIGMAVAIDLALRGVRTIVLESRFADESFGPRTNQTNSRSMEHFRRWGIADRLRSNDPIDPELKRDVRFTTRVVGGYTLANLEGGVEWATRFPFASETPEWAPNPAIEKTFRDRVAELDLIDLRFGVEVTGFTQTDDGVAVEFVDRDGTTGSVHGAFLVAADGSRSTIRRQLGVKLEGLPNLVTAMAWHVHAPALKELARPTGLSAFYWLINEDRTGLIVFAQDSEDTYLFFDAPAPAGVDPDDWTSVRDYYVAQIGADLELESLGGGQLMVHSVMAPRYDYGRVLLAGDAAHLISPYGGFGMNIGIGDAADIGWKLAAILQGWGGDALIPSYSVERREAETWILDVCAKNTSLIGPNMTRDHMEQEGPIGEAARNEVTALIFEKKVSELKSMGAQLGYQYNESPIVVHQPDPPQSTAGDYIPTASPGSRLPHVWIDDTTSLYDRLGPWFTLITTVDGVDTSALEAAARDRGFPLEVYAPGLPDLAEMYEAKLVLVRPDQHVAWRGDAVPEDAVALIDLVRGHV